MAKTMASSNTAEEISRRSINGCCDLPIDQRIPLLSCACAFSRHTRDISRRNTDVDAEELTNAVRSTLDGKPRISWEESRCAAIARVAGDTACFSQNMGNGFIGVLHRSSIFSVGKINAIGWTGRANGRLRRLSLFLIHTL